MANLVTEEELSKERSSSELIKWIQNKFAEIAEIEGGKDAVRMRKGRCKELVEEVYPLSIFASKKYGEVDDVYFKPVIGSQNYDAIVRSKDENYKLEITLAHEGELEFLRRFMLKERGYAPASGQIKKTGTKNTGRKLELELVAKNVDDHLREQIDLIRDALGRKLKKDYDLGTSLLIMFEDVVSFDEEEERKVLYSTVEQELGPLSNMHGFSKLYLTSWSKRIFIEWGPDG
jgi:hypothetical protein